MWDFAFPQLMRPFDNPEQWRETEDISGDLDIDLRLFEALTGVKMPRQELTRVAENVFTLERTGRQRKMEEALAPHFKLPCRADGTLVDRAGFAKLLDEYYIARGWDIELGWPLSSQLEALGLIQAIPELERLRLALKDRTGG
jgi:aldehyde:ferredoxin oxidoreductase